MTVKILTEHHLELISLKGGCTGSSESTLVKMPHCWKSHLTTHLTLPSGFDCCPFYGGGSFVSDSLFNVTPICVWGFCVWSMFWYALLSVLSSFVSILGRKREKALL